MSSRSVLHPARRVVVVLVAAMVLVPLVPRGTASAATDTNFRFEGRGWGHGIGMSQYGAQGQALEGRGYQGILAHYYQGTSVGERPVDGEVVVGIQQDVAQTTLVSHGGTTELQFGSDQRTFEARDGEEWTLAVGGAQQCQLTGPSTPQPSPSPTETETATEEPTDEPSDEPTPPEGECRLIANPPDGVHLEVVDRGMSYERGRVLVRPAMADTDAATDGKEFQDAFHVTVALPMHHYLFGLSEMPYSWEVHALRAQAVAGRSYVTHRILSLNGAVRDQCACHVYDSVQDQVYKGRRDVGDSWWPRWRDAVLDTRDQVVLAPDQPGTRDGVVQAFYSSSSGGRTENVHEVWNSAPVPYLTSVDDHWARDRSLNPYASWIIEKSPEAVASAISELDDVHSLRVTARNTSGSAATVEITGTQDGAPETVTRTGQQVRSALGLRSAYIDRIFLPPFVDDDGSPFEADIAWVADQGITRGCNPPDNDRFCPSGTVTRGQMAAFLARALELTETSGVEFDDVPDDHTFAEDIDKIYTAGITDGCGDGSRFCPGDPIPRDQMAAFLAEGLELTATSDPGFEDVPDDHFFAEEIDKVATAGITRGCNEDGTRFCPDDPVSRGQMAAFLARALR